MLGEFDETQQVQFKVENVPFLYAIPVLTGWQLEYPCSDHHVETIGVWIKGFSYEKAPGAATGTLFYTIESILTDDAILWAAWRRGAIQHQRPGAEPHRTPPQTNSEERPGSAIAQYGLTGG